MRIFQRIGIAVGSLGIFLMTVTQVHAQETTLHPSVSIPGTEIRTLTSSHTGEQYDIYVQPIGNASADQQYPVVYLLDAHWDFPMVAGIYGGLRADQFVPDAILVGITYSGENLDYGSLRAKDLTPTSMEQMEGSGRAPKFLSFIEEELIPYIESEYQADPTDRTLMGSSFGGLFTLYAFLHTPNLFQRYVAPSSSLWWDNGIMFKYEEALAEKKSDLPAKLYMTAGELEGSGMIDPMQKLAGALQSRDYPSLRFEAKVIEGARHSSVKPESFMRGLRYVFAPDTLVLAPDLLEPMVGRYKVDIPSPEEIIVEIVLEGQQLILETGWNGEKLKVFAASDSTFFFRETTMHLMVDRSAAGAIQELKIDQGRILTAHRIE